MLLTQLFFFAIIFVTSSSGYKILGLFPHVGKSHFMVFDPILKELANRGHNVTVFSFFPQKKPIPNLYDVDLSLKEEVQTTEVINFQESVVWHGKPLNDILFLKDWGLKACDVVLANEKIKELFRNDEKYDVILYEMFIHDCIIPVVGKLNTPYIGLSSSNLMPWLYEAFGFIDNPNYIPNLMLPHGVEMSFRERIYNSFSSWSYKLIWNLISIPHHQAMAEKHIPSPVPKIQDVIMETNLILINTHFTITGAKPMGANFIEIAGVHLGKIGKLPENLKRWMDDSANGVIFFSMGSMLRGSSLPEEKRNAFLQVFGELKEHVLWKWEDPELPGKSNNVHIEKWLPQREILDHPNTKLFITHCGMLSAIEAVSSGVPTLCIPMYGDQGSNQRGLEYHGVSVFLEYDEITSHTLREKLFTALKPKYKQRALEVQSAFHDRPLSPLDTAVYWVEYIARQKGGKFLKLATRRLPWYQKFLLDIFAIFALIIIIFVLIIRWIIRKMLKLQEKKKKVE